MKKLATSFMISILFGQYDYSLEDINPSSEFYGTNVGTSFFEGKVTLHYFGHYTWGTCTARFEQLNELYDSLKLQGLAVELIGIGKDTHLSYSDNWTDDNDSPVCADDSPFSVWTNWGASQRDLFVVDLEGSVALHQNVTSGIPDDLEDLILSLLEPEIDPCELGIVHVSEVQSSGDPGDYLEIHNSGDADCSLEGFQLDDSEELEDLTFGNVIIPAGGYWIGYEGQDSSFSSDLNSDGGAIIFADPQGEMLSVVLEPSQELDGIKLSQSYDLDGVGCHTYPSPGSENGDCVTLDIDQRSLLPNDITLYQNYPNPFNPLTTIKYDIPINIMVAMTIIDLRGNVVRDLVNAYQKAGSKLVKWNGKNNDGMQVSAGMYLCRMQINGLVKTKKMLLLK